MLADVLAKGNRMADLTYEEAVLDACVTSWIDPAGKTPKEILHALMMWEQQLALDPLVSEVAADWKRRADLGDAAMALRDQEVALSGRLRERAEQAEQEVWKLKQALRAVMSIAFPVDGGADGCGTVGGRNAEILIQARAALTEEKTWRTTATNR